MLSPPSPHFLDKCEGLGVEICRGIGRSSDSGLGGPSSCSLGLPELLEVDGLHLLVAVRAQVALVTVKLHLLISDIGNQRVTELI